MNTERDEALADMAKYRREWKVNFRKKSLMVLIEEYDRFRELVLKHPHRLDEDDKILAELNDQIDTMESKFIRQQEQACPIAFFKPSWEQAQCMNAWHPEFDPMQPEGYRTVGNFSSVRVGKTWGAVASTVLWVVPGDKDWPLYEPYTDHLGREVRVLWRFNWDYWWKTGRMVDPLAGESPKNECQIWQGVPDETHWHQKIEPVFRRFMPPSQIAHGPMGEIWMKAEKYFKTVGNHTVAAKLYGSDQSAWSGDEVWLGNVDEGPPRDKMDELIFRTRYIHWAYTPREARNLGDRAKLAFDAYKGNYPLVGATKFFFFHMKDVAEHVMSKRDRDERIAKAKRMGDAGRITIEGGFFESSPVVFTNFQRMVHILPWSGEEFKKRFPDACFIRGMDEGTAHPTTCCWVAILKTGEYIAYREFSEAGLSVSPRCEKIIAMSGNEREVTKWHAEEQLRRYREKMTTEKIRRTFLDRKVFRRDPMCVQDDWTDNYRRAGLSVEESTELGPKARCDYTNDLFLPDHTRKHLAYGTEWSHLFPEHGYRLYLCNDLPITVERLENYLQQQIKSGANVGQFTGQPDKVGDDEIDALCFAVCSKLRWFDTTLMESRLGSGSV